MKRFIASLPFLLMGSTIINAEPIGVYTGIELGQLVYQDDRIESDAETSDLSIALGVEMPLSRISNVFVAGSYLDQDFRDNSGGASFAGYTVKAGYERKFRGFPFQPWFGAGVVYTYGESTNNFITNSSGFVVERPADEDVSEFSFFVSARKKYDIGTRGNIIAGVDYIIPNDGIGGFKFNLGYVYNFGD
jgi:hypothetical protein